MAHAELILPIDSMERLVPDEVELGDVTGESTLSLHLERYDFAADHTLPGRLLDISCGVGYGTRHLADRKREVTAAVGVDISASAIDFARQRYSAPHIDFVVADAMQYTSPEKFDTVVSLETVEHLPNPGAFVERLIGLLEPGGVLISSVPTTPSVDANPHHQTDFSERSFRRLFTRHGLKEIACFRQIQPYRLMPLLTRQESRAKNLRRNLPLYYLTHPISLLRRIGATLRYGFSNRYVTIAWQA